VGYQVYHDAHYHISSKTAPQVASRIGNLDSKRTWLFASGGSGKGEIQIALYSSTTTDPREKSPSRSPGVNRTINLRELELELIPSIRTSKATASTVIATVQET
jgi:hypothetical protein